MTEELEVVVVNPEEYGLDHEKVEGIEEAFSPSVMSRKLLSKEYGKVIKKKLTEEVCEEAKSLRLRLVKVRTGIDKVHKTQKAFFWSAGKFVDAWKNKETTPIADMEAELKGIETHFERIEEERVQRIHDSRKAQLEEYGVEAIPENLGVISDEVFNQVLGGAKMFYESEKERLANEEKERLEKEKIDKLSKDRKDFIIEKNLYQYRDKEDLDSLGLITDKEWTTLLNSLIERQRVADEENERIRKENIELKKKADKAEKEKKERLAAEEKKKQQEEAAIQAELSKGDAEKFRNLVNDLKGLKTKYTFKSKAKRKSYEEVGVMLDKMIAHINK